VTDDGIVADVSDLQPLPVPSQLQNALAGTLVMPAGSSAWPSTMRISCPSIVRTSTLASALALAVPLASEALGAERRA
jgi:hypothetical protein